MSSFYSKSFTIYYGSTSSWIVLWSTMLPSKKLYKSIKTSLSRLFFHFDKFLCIVMNSTGFSWGGKLVGIIHFLIISPISECHMMLVLDNVLIEMSKMERLVNWFHVLFVYLVYSVCSESPTMLSMMLSLAGAGCIVTNQSFTSIKSNSSNVNNIVQGIL